MAESDTIFALATPPGRSALAVFRISGPSSRSVLDLLTRGNPSLPRLASLRSLHDPVSGAKLDDAVVTLFVAPSSYTGEDLLEISCHGGRGVISAVTAALARISGVRPATPGEFTRRAFLAGKFDLSQAEAIADLIDSETEFQRRQALRLLDGGLGRLAEGWRARLLEISAQLESALDFSDEGDVSSLDSATLLRDSSALRDEIAGQLALGQRSLKVLDGFTVVIAGPPNVGKSTLFNRIAGSDLAIVSEHAGTTRDLVRVNLDLDGIPVTLIDSAGIRDSDDPVEQIGIDRARSAASSADLVLALVSEGTPAEGVCGVQAYLPVWSKADLFRPPDEMIAVSENDSDSISSLLRHIRELALSSVGDGSLGLVTRQRHISAMSEAFQALNRFEDQLGLGNLELAAEECRLVNSRLGDLAGGFETEELLGSIFQRFCIGK